MWPTADGYGLGYTLTLLLQKEAEGLNARSTPCLADVAPVCRGGATDVFLDGVKLSNACQRLRGNGSLALLGQLEELSPQMAPAKGDRNPIAVSGRSRPPYGI